MFLTNAKAFCVAGALLSAGSAYAACPTGTSEIGELNGKNLCKLSGTYTDALVLTNDNSYVLSGGVFVGDGKGQSTSMTIQAGTTVYAESGADFLVIQGSKIFAEVLVKLLSFSQRANRRTHARWWGGRSNGCTINNCGDAAGVVMKLKVTLVFTAKRSLDNSGVLRTYVEFAGFEISPENELNDYLYKV